MLKLFAHFILALALVSFGFAGCGGTADELDPVTAELETLQSLPEEAIDMSEHELHTTPPVETEELTCYNATCRQYGANANAYCTELCGDVAYCFINSFGCGPWGCCVLM